MKFSASISLRLVLGVLLLSLGLATAQNGVTFLYPTDGLVFNYLDTVNVTYQSEFAAPGLWTFCRDVNVETLFPSTSL